MPVRSVFRGHHRQSVSKACIVLGMIADLPHSPAALASASALSPLSCFSNVRSVFLEAPDMRQYRTHTPISPGRQWPIMLSTGQPKSLLPQYFSSTHHLGLLIRFRCGFRDQRLRQAVQSRPSARYKNRPSRQAPTTAVILPYPIFVSDAVICPIDHSLHCTNNE